MTVLIDAANVDVEPIWATLLAKALEGKNVSELLSNIGSGGGAPAAGAAPSGAPAAGAAAPAEEKQEEKKEEKEESDEDMVCITFKFKTRISMSYVRASGCSIEENFPPLVSLFPSCAF